LIYESFNETFGNIVPYYRPKGIKSGYERSEVDMVAMKRKLIKTRRRVDYRTRNFNKSSAQKSDAHFEFTPHRCAAEREKLFEPSPGKMRKETREGVYFKFIAPCCRLREKLESRKQYCEATRSRKETQVTIGKTSLLLSILKRKNVRKCYDHSLLAYSI